MKPTKLIMTTTIDEEEKTEFQFHELSQSAKDHVCQKYAEWGMNHEWWEHIYEDYRERCEAAGFLDPQFSFSGFWSQGDGACFSCERFVFDGADALNYLTKEDHDYVLVKIAEARLNGFQTTFHISGRITAGGHYYHRYSMGVGQWFADFDPTGHDGADALLQCVADKISWEASSELVLEAARDIAHDLYKSLQDEYEYQISEEQVALNAEANDWRFSESGDLL